MNDDDNTVNSRATTSYGNAVGAVIDAAVRNDAAYTKYQDFFDEPEYAARVDAARVIIDDFFKVKDMYENTRGNRGNPFTVIKVTNHMFPKVSLSQKAKLYRDPLAELGVEIKYANATNSYLFYIR